jgi:hypothetical protein
VNYGSDGTTVTATPAAGYHFVRWSDGVLTAARADLNVTVGHAVTATFAFTLLPTKLTINAFYSSRPHGRFDYFYGAISPRMTLGTPIGFYVKKPGSRTWVRVVTRFTANSHNWSYSYRLVSRGTYYFQVRFAATAKYKAVTSRTISVRSR